jgi:hypothetical protein
MVRRAHRNPNAGHTDNDLSDGHHKCPAETAGKRIHFTDLANGDLYVDAIYEGGTAGTFGDDPISRLLPCTNRGGFRVATRPGDKRHALVVLYSTLADADWPDHLDLDLGRFTYYGDNKHPGHELVPGKLWRGTRGHRRPPRCDSRHHRLLDQNLTTRLFRRLHVRCGKPKARVCGPFDDGASRARTGDLRGAIQALSQLSYSPGRADCS